MTCLELNPVQEIRCLDQLNLTINQEIDRLRIARKPCIEVPENSIADCDCYAERKAARLKSMGYNARTRVVIILGRGQPHRVTEVDGRIFDNLSPWTYKINQARTYIWLAPDAQWPR